MTDGPGLSQQIGSAGTILLVEDNEANRILALRQLERLGYPARAVSNGREAVEAFVASTYALILMDCQMPEMNGFEATRQIRRRETPDAPRIPIVAMTASATDRDREACVASGMDDFITKPVMIHVLGAVLGHWVGRQGPTRPASRASTPWSVPDRTVDQVALARFRGELGEQAFRRFLEAYLSELPKRMDAIRRAVEDHMLEALREAAHALKSPSAALGATAIARMCGELETLERADEAEWVRTLVRRLEVEYRSVRDALMAERHSQTAAPPSRG